MRIAIYSGSFNPLHIGHLAVLEEVDRCGKFDWTYLVVVAQESAEGFGAGGNGPRPAAGCDTGGIASSATACVGG